MDVARSARSCQRMVLFIALIGAAGLLWSGCDRGAQDDGGSSSSAPTEASGEQPTTASTEREAPAAGPTDSPPPSDEAAAPTVDNSEASAPDPANAAGEPGSPDSGDTPPTEDALRDQLLAWDAPLPEPYRGKLWGTVTDAPPEILDASRPELEGRHYMSSDEWNLHLFEPKLRDLGGVYMGVGTDQGYLMMGWQKPVFAFLADYDPWVALEHEIYLAFFAEATTPAELIKLWANEGRGLEVIRARLGEHPRLDGIEEVYDQYHSRIASRLQRLRDRLDLVEVAGFVNDQAQFEVVKKLVANQRVRPIQSNLLAEQAVTNIGAVLHEIDVPMRAFYVSNAESYWNWNEGNYKANVESLPYDEQSLVLRTLASHPVNDDYRYVVQPALNYLEWLRNDEVPPNVIYMVPRRRLKGPDDIEYRFFDDPPAAGLARLEERRKRKRRERSDDEEDIGETESRID